MIRIKLNERVDFLDNDFLTRSELPIDLQWKIYRGTLSRQSLPLNIYTQFKEQYDTFYRLHDKLTDGDVKYDFNFVNELDSLGNSLEKLYDSVSEKLTNSAKFELKICLEKIVNYLKDMREKVTNEQFM